MSDARAPAATEDPPAPGAARPEPGAGATRKVRLSWQVVRYLGAGLATNGTISFLGLEAVLGIIFTVRATEGLSIEILLIFPVLLAAFVQAMSYTVPVALLFGTGLLLGRLNADREVTALRSFGVSPLQLLLPAVAVGAVLAGLGYQVNSEWVPRMRYANRSAESWFLDRIEYLGEGWGRSYKSGAMTLWIHHHDGPHLEGVYASFSRPIEGMPLPQKALEQVQAPSYPIYVVAERAWAHRDAAGELVLELREVDVFFDQDFVPLLGKRFREPAPEGTGAPAPPAAPEGPRPAGRSSDFLQRAHFSSWTWPVRLPAKSPTAKDLGREPLAEETARRLEALRRAEASGDPTQVRSARRDYMSAVTELHRRLALSLCALTFPLTAFLIGLQVRSPNRLLPFFLASTTVPAVFFSFEILGNYLSRQGIAPWAMEELGNAALLLLCAGLFTRARAAPRR
ncbi:MAG: LptF/LptG family permease [Planctomycetes bacterium]|nr:LptF/LptG family permease [Planctomycetota bacterium]